MSKNLVFITMLFYALVSCKSTKNIEINKRYMESYTFLSKKYGEGKIIVSDTIVDIEIANFFDALKEDSNQKESSKLLDSLLKIDEENKFERYCLQLDKVLNTSKKGNFKLFFSKPNNNYLLAQIFEIDNEKSNNYDALTMFGSSEVYLFYFRNDKIKKHYNIILDYN